MITLTPLADVPKVAYEDAFLIEDLVTSRITFVTGEPKAGTSALVIGMLRAMIESHDDFVGQKVLRKVDHIGETVGRRALFSLGARRPRRTRAPTIDRSLVGAVDLCHLTNAPSRS